MKLPADCEVPRVDETRRGQARQVLDRWIKALEYKRGLEADPAATLLSIIVRQAESRGDSLALIDERAKLTYSDLVRRSGVYTNWARQQGLGPGDVVCLLMPNCAEYMAIWLGITEIRCVVALINTSLVGDGLEQSITVTSATQIIVAKSLLETFEAVVDRLPPEIGLWTYDDGLSCVRPPGINEKSPRRAGDECGLTASAHDRGLMIFTSGTTGLPKAAYVTHARILEWSGWFAGMMDACADDRMYNCLPMYHSVGGVVAVGAMLLRGGSVVIRQRFSAARFWNDVSESECTIFQYIGELCRYLTHMPDVPASRSHKLRLCCGNGLRAEVWPEFKTRFAIPEILEFYAATEGNVSLYNCEGKPGAIGRLPSFLAHRFPIALIRVDPESGAPIRDEAGRCIPCGIDEPGEAVGRIETDSPSAARRFEGYTDSAATSAKILCDTFKTGDRWFRTGDLMRRDRSGYFYFVDRMGDTFRWKGENISTLQVAGVIMGCHGVLDAVVYGVALDGADGRAGMATLVVDERFNLVALRAHMMAHLPPHGVPVFVRLCDEIPMTGTFKLARAALARQGIDVEVDKGQLWVNDAISQQFRLCDTHLIEKIKLGAVRI